MQYLCEKGMCVWSWPGWVGRKLWELTPPNRVWEWISRTAGDLFLTRKNNTILNVVLLSLFFTMLIIYVPTEQNT